MDEPVKVPHPKEIIMVGRWRPVSPVGVDRTIVNLTRQLLALGQRVVVWSPSTRLAEIRRQDLEDGLAQFELPMSLSGLYLPRRTRQFIQEHSAGAWLAHFHCAFTPANNAIASALRCPYTLTPNGPYSPAGFNLRTALKKRIWIAVSEKAYLERAAFIHALSEQEQADIQRLCAQQHFVIAPNGITLDAASATQNVAARARAAPAERTLLFLGRLAIHHKGLDRLVIAFSEANVPSARLRLVGPDFRGCQAKLERLANGLGLAERVNFQGAVYGDEKWKALGEGDVFVHLSRWEGIPFAVLEAMSLAKPVLVSLGTNLADYIRREQAGWVAEGDDFVSAIRQALLASGAELVRRGASGRRLIESEFQWSGIARKILAGYAQYCP